jgi:hypothetical protein
MIRAIAEEKKIVKMVPIIPIKLPIAVMSFISPPPRLSLPVKSLKTYAVARKTTKLKTAPLKADFQVTSVAGKKEIAIPITISGNEITSGMICWLKSIKKMIIPAEMNMMYLKKTGFKLEPVEI